MNTNRSALGVAEAVQAPPTEHFVGIKPKCFRSLLLLLTVALTGSQPLMAGPIVLDRFSYSTYDTVIGGSGFAGSTEFAQVFSVANTGTLDQIDVVVANQWALLPNTNPLFMFEIRRVVAGAPVEEDSFALISREAAITSNARNQNGPANLISFTDLGISVSGGDLLAIVLRAGAGGAFTWLSGDHSYEGKNNYVRDADNPANFDYNWYGPYSSKSFAFQTFVECADPSNCHEATSPDAVPEPSTLLLVSTGLVSIIGRARKRLEKRLGYPAQVSAPVPTNTC